MDVNWNMIIALAAVVAALAAIASAGAIVRQTKKTLLVQILFQLLSQWESRAMQNTRSCAAGYIIDGHPENLYVDDVLDFFETVAVFSKRKLLDKELAWHTFYWPMVNYWCKTESYIREAQKEEGDETWKDYSELIQALIQREGSERPTPEQLKYFFETETSRYVALS
jgi:hypothetical protein